MQKIMTLLLCAAVLSGCATQKTGKECADNFAVSGSLLTGKTFTSSVSLPNTPFATAYDRAHNSLVREGFYIQNADAKRGAISAYQDVILSERTAPLNVQVEQAGSGSRVNLVFVVAGGMYAPESGVRDGFCRITDGVTQQVPVRPQ